jgi:TonB family protein
MKATRSPKSRGSDYVLHSDLARLCLPAEYKDSARRLAWANSICALFLAVGIIGIKQPKIVTKPLTKPRDIIPIVFTQPEMVLEKQGHDTETAPPDHVLEAASPIVPTVVAANTPDIAFAVPVKQTAILAPAHLVSRPPPQATALQTPNITRFDPDADGRTTPHPEYPLLALRRGYQGKVVIDFVVGESGSVTKAEVAGSSGYSVLDEAALSVVMNRWRFPPGGVRYHYVVIIFKLK